MITGSKDLLEWIDDSDCAFWKIFPYTGGTDKFIHSADDKDDLSKQVSMEKLRKTLGYLSQGRYRVQCKPENKTAKGFREVIYEHEGKASGSAIEGMSQTPAFVGFTKEDIQKEIATALATERMERKLETLEKENAELKKENKEYSSNTLGSAIGRIIEKVEPHIHRFLPPVPTQTAMVAGLGYENDTTNTMSYIAPMSPPITDQEAKERLTNAITAWCEKDPQKMLAIIEKVVSVLYADQPTYEFQVKMLLG